MASVSQFNSNPPNPPTGPGNVAPNLLGSQTATPQQQAVDSLLTGNNNSTRTEDESGYIQGPSESFRKRIDYPAEAQDRMIRSRLGMASSLFTALRCKHADSAAHSLRVALLTSAWSYILKLPEEERVAIEIAALLHDIGKVGLPDTILLKPGRLSPEERAIVDRHRLMGVEILSSSCASLKILEIVSNIPTWFDGSRMKLDLQGENLPLGSRMIAIIDAYDAMTTPQVYRPAMTHERAIQELFSCAEKQFDPKLVQSFSSYQTYDLSDFQQKVAKNWLSDIGPQSLDLHWQLNKNFTRRDNSAPTMLFQQRLLDNMYDAVIFLDANMQIMLWNRGTERLTGIVSSNTYQKIYDPQMIQMRDERGYDITDLDCPISFALKSRVQSMRRMIISGRNKNDVSVNVHTIPVVDSDGTLFGAAVLLHDASGEVSLEEQCQDWQARATRDQLTQLANRAEFDREIDKLVKEHIDRGLPCSLIITDIDRFKSVNDNYGHQVGDEVLVSFAQTLKSVCPSSFIVARYGGEEFVILCATTDCATAARLADEIRRTWAQIPQPGMGGKSVTASFGVTELQNGDTPDIILRRADRALYMAKEGGRNKVVQLGTGLDNETAPERRKRGWWPWRWRQETTEYCRNMVTLVPLPMTIEKLRGFISDHGATVLSTDDHSIRLEVTSTPKMHKRSSDRPETMTLELRFIESNQTIKVDHHSPARSVHCTKIQAKAMPKRLRNRRSDSVEEAAKQVLASIKAYLMAQDDHELPLQETM